jgi:7,8-dihydroneopterin aldolase/epimerase/oxygenase
MVVWAPSKMVLDTPGAPGGADPLTLVVWMAEVMHAAAVLVHGTVAIPAESRVPIRYAGLV